MGGSIRMSGIPWRPADKVPAKHGGTEMVYNPHENEPPPVFYDKNGIVQDKPVVVQPARPTKAMPDFPSAPYSPNTLPTVTSTQTYESQYNTGKPVVSNAKRVSTATVSELRAEAKSRKASPQKKA